MSIFSRVFFLALVCASVAYLYIAAPPLFSKPVPALEKIGLALWPVSEVGEASKAGGGRGPARAGSAGSAGRGRGGEVLVRVAKVETRAADTFVRAVGTGTAVKSTTLFAETSGRVVKLDAEAGEHVSAGALIMQLDSQNEALAVDRSKVAVQDAKDQLNRYKQLISSNTISSVQLQTAETALRNAELDLEAAQVALTRRSVIAPFDGVIGFVDVEIGDYISPTTKIATLDDRTTILIEFVVPERFLGKVARGDLIEVMSDAMKGQKFEGVVSALDSRIDSASRTLRVQAKVENDDDRILPGLSFDVKVLLTGEMLATIPAIALHWDKSGSYVWLLSEGKVRRQDVSVLDRESDVVFVGGDIVSGDVVITETTQDLRDGLTVRVLPSADRSLQDADQQNTDKKLKRAPIPVTNDDTSAARKGRG